MLAAIALLAAATSLPPSGDDQLSAFKQTCAVATSYTGLISTLTSDGWTAYPSPEKSHLAKELAAVEPMLDAQGLSSDYTVYAHDANGRHLELAVSKTRKPLANGRRLIGCSLYDFAASEPIPADDLEPLANKAKGQASLAADVQIETWKNINGPGTDMRAVFVPPSSA